MQHELLPRVSVTGGYYRRQFYNIQYTKNRASIRTATSRRSPSPCRRTPNLPNGGGQVITLYNLNANKLGAVNNVVDAGPTNNTRVYNGFEFSVNARLRSGFVFGGITTERTATDNCTDLHATRIPTTCGSAIRCRRSRRSTRRRRLHAAVRHPGAADRSRRGRASASGRHYTFTSALARALTADRRRAT